MVGFYFVLTYCDGSNVLWWPALTTCAKCFRKHGARVGCGLSWDEYQQMPYGTSASEQMKGGPHLAVRRDKENRGGGRWVIQGQESCSTGKCRRIRLGLELALLMTCYSDLVSCMDNFGSSLGLIGSQEGFNSKAAWVLCTD